MRLGIDLGGTKIEGVVLDAAGVITARRRVPTPQGDYDGTVRAIVDLVRRLESETGVGASIGMGMPGIISPATGLVKNANSVCLNGRPLDRDLLAALGRPLRIENDANCFALSEASDGAAAGRECVFGVILGTGTGGGVVVRGRILHGRNAVGGEWGHNPMPWPESGEWPGESCYCGRSGCIETFLSGPGLARDYKQATGQPAEPVEIVGRAGAGEREAVSCLDRYVNRLARALATIINVIDPDAIVLGGGLSSIERLYRDVPAQWSRYVFSDRVTTELLSPKFGDSSGVRGAAWLWPEKA
ncbi:MAG: ROK family protein [Vicinamibacteria bacterium]|nr:ROK family protein [Vicinamibacteria bacterium]